jgi:hypothetical protein
MKNNIQYKLITFLLVASLSAGCDSSIVEDLEIGKPFDQTEAIQGSWNLTSVSQIDELSSTKASEDLSEYFLTEPTLITFTGSTYTISGPTDVPNNLGTGGTWSFDNAEMPSQVNLVSGGETFSMSLGAPIRDFEDTLLLKKSTTTEDLECVDFPRVKLLFSYQYTFERE